MSDIGYFSNMFHHLGDLTIELNNALNLIVRSYRVNVPKSNTEEAKTKLLSFLDLALGRDTPTHPSWVQHTRMILDAFLDKKRLHARLNMIREKIDSGKPLSKSEIKVLDDLISQVSQEATIAFRKMKKAS